jgi:chromosomal replication initiator protein
LNRQVVLSSDRAPKAIPTLEERLRSRFEGGMIADISKPDFETRVAILRKKASNDGLEITEDALRFIASNITHNIRELEGALNRVAVSSQLTKNEITIDFASSVLSELISSGKRKGITHKHIVKAISEFFDISPDDLVVKGRKKEVVKPRQIAMYLMRSELNYSYPGIGERLGGRDHTTAIHAFEKIKKELEFDEKLREEIAFLKNQIYNID